MINELNKMLDNGHAVTLFKNELGSYTAFALSNTDELIVEASDKSDELNNLTDDHTVEKSVIRLSDKILNLGDYQEE